MFPPHCARRRASRLLLALGATLVAVPTVASAIPAPTVIRNDDCFTGAKPSHPKPISSTKLPKQGRVDIRGALKVRGSQIGPLTVGGCSSGIKHLLSRTYVLVKAPGSNRYMVTLTAWKTTGGLDQSLAPPAFADDASFTAAVAPLPQVLTIPGIKGTVYGPLGSPFALMATRASGKPYSRRAKLALGKAYVATGGYASQPGI